MRPRIAYKSLAQRIADKKRELASIVASEQGCSMTVAYNRVDFNLQYKRV